MPKNKSKISFAGPINLSKSPHGCVPISGVTINPKALSVKMEPESSFNVDTDPGQAYRKIGFLMQNGTNPVAVIVQKQRSDEILPKNGKTSGGSYRLAFNGMADPKQVRLATDYLRDTL